MKQTFALFRLPTPGRAVSWPERWGFFVGFGRTTSTPAIGGFKTIFSAGPPPSFFTIYFLLLL
jgi:hypothetical protein